MASTLFGPRLTLTPPEPSAAMGADLSLPAVTDHLSASSGPTGKRLTAKWLGKWLSHSGGNVSESRRKPLYPTRTVSQATEMGPVPPVVSDGLLVSVGQQMAQVPPCAR